MNKTKEISLLLLLAFIAVELSAQVAMGEWRTHFSYGKMSQVEQTPDKIFGLSGGSLLSVGKEDELLTKYSKVNLLSDQTVAAIRYNKVQKTLLIAYANGNIDLLSQGRVRNIPDLKNKDIPAVKAPNDICFHNEFAYLCNGIGLIVVNLEKREIADTYTFNQNGINVPILSVAIVGDSIYALSADRIFAAQHANRFLSNGSNWISRPTGVTGSKLLAFAGQLFLRETGGNVYKERDNTAWEWFAGNTKNIREDGSCLLLVSENLIRRFDNTLTEVDNSTGIAIQDAAFDTNENVYWAASATHGLLKMQNGNTTQQIKPDGPIAIANKLHFEQGRLYAWQSSYPGEDTWERIDSLMIFDRKQWINHTRDEQMNLFGLAIDRSDNTHYYITSPTRGVLEYRNDAFYQLHEKMCNIDMRILMHGIAIDHNNVMWLNQANNDDGTIGIQIKTVKTILPDGRCLEPNYAPISATKWFDRIFVASNNYKWFVLPHASDDPGVFILDDQNDAASRNMHRYRHFESAPDQDGITVSFSSVDDVAEDKDKNIWLGHAGGVVVFENIDNLFNSGYSVKRPKIPRNDGSGLADFLLDNQQITAIAVDGANRKWLGTTQQGAFLVSEDGVESIHHFTVENSPLLSNNITDIAIDNQTGEVFFATDEGLISYMSDAADGAEEFTKGSLSVYPNPVREDFMGEITIEGLMANSVVEITDAVGNLVYKTRSNGGIATWDGRSVSGKVASAGVYFVVGISEDGKQSEMTKILLIR